MKASKMLISTLKEAPQEAQIDSHILLIRSGMIRKLAAGVYNYLPLGVRTLRKIEDIIRDEMDKAGAQEILSSAIQPKELWEASGRWYKYGPELMRFKDRHNREFCLGPTHEEIFTDLVKNEVKSYKSLPLNIYQIQTKYRDEIRPRFGLIRGREFIMKDAYSFDVDEAGLEASYQNMYDTYTKIFTRLHLNFVPVLADTGAIGGSISHQFMALTSVGESNILYCKHCGYAADEEKAETVDDTYKNDEKELALEKVSTPNVKTIEELAAFLNVDKKDIAKSVVYVCNKELYMFLIRGDREVNFIKVCNALKAAEHEVYLASDEDIINALSVPGFIGPCNSKMHIFIDSELAKMKNVYCGANEKDYHLKNVNFKRDFDATICDIKDVKENDLCPVCHKPLLCERGIEVGQVFKLGTKYSEPLGCTVLNNEGKTIPMIMGCYGIGVTRTMSSIIEQNHDENGIIWPLNVAPYHAVIVCVNYEDETQRKLADAMYEELLAKRVEVILDDRDYKPGFKFKDWDLIGIPLIVTVGRRAGENIVEFKERKDNIKHEIDAKECIDIIVDKVIKEG